MVFNENMVVFNDNNRMCISIGGSVKCRVGDIPKKMTAGRNLHIWAQRNFHNLGENCNTFGGECVQFAHRSYRTTGHMITEQIDHVIC